MSHAMAVPPSLIRLVDHHLDRQQWRNLYVGLRLAPVELAAPSRRQPLRPWVSIAGRQ
jgi:hypothetical protein